MVKITVMATYGIGLDWKTGDYYVVVNGQRVARTFGSNAQALGYVDALKDVAKEDVMEDAPEGAVNAAGRFPSSAREEQ